MQAKRVVLLFVVAVSLAVAGRVGVVRSNTALSLEERHARLLAGAECRSVAEGDFFTTEEKLRAEAWQAVAMDDFPSVSPEFKERWKAGKAGVMVYVPLCPESQQIVWDTLRRRGMSNALMEELGEVDLEEIARLRLPFRHLNKLTSGPVVAESEIQSIGSDKLYLAESMGPCSDDIWVGDYCRTIRTYWRWRTAPFWTLTDKIAWAWSRQWHLIEDEVTNYWREYGCFYNNCCWFMMFDQSAFNTELDKGTSIEMDIAWERWHGDDLYNIRRWTGYGEISIYKDRGSCPCTYKTMQALSRYYHQRLAITGSFSYTDSPSISISPSFPYEPSYDVWRSYRYLDS